MNGTTRLALSVAVLAPLAGDGDGDGFHPEFPVNPGIDALQIGPPFGEYQTLRDVYPSTDIDLPCAGSGTIEPGDVSAIYIDAVTNGMIDDTQIRAALGIAASTLSFNVDAITRDSTGTIFVSFEETVPRTSPLAARTRACG